MWTSPLDIDLCSFVPSGSDGLILAIRSFNGNPETRFACFRFPQFLMINTRLLHPFRNLTWMSTTLCAGILLLPLLGGVTVSAKALVTKDFDSIPGAAPLSRKPFQVWRGPEGNLYGNIEISDANATGGSGKAIFFRDTSSAFGCGPNLTIDWKEYSPATGHLVVEWKWMVPIEGPYFAGMFLGRDWSDAAAILLFENGLVWVQYGKGDKRELLGKYTAGEWRVVKFDLDIEERTFELFLDGAKAVNGFPFQIISPKTVDRLSIVADFAAIDRKGAPVLALDNVKVEATK